ncbi:MAG: protein translocase subunit SecD [Gammaproteobacteria bacterium]
MNRYPMWKYAVLGLILLFSFIYAVPNLFGEDHAVQISNSQGIAASGEMLDSIKDALGQAKIQYKSVELDNDETVLIRFNSGQAQLEGQDVLQSIVGKQWTVALNLAPVTPKWLSALGAEPMKLGLDLRGGVHFLVEVDLESAIHRRAESYLTEIRNVLREGKLRYLKIAMPSSSEVSLLFREKEARDEGFKTLVQNLPELEFSRVQTGELFEIQGRINQQVIQDIRNQTVEQTIITLRNRVNELGVAESVVQRQGLNHVVVELPGIQDTARAKDILGKTATLEFKLRDHDHDVSEALSGRSIPGAKLYYDKEGIPVLLKNRVLLSGDAIIGAVVGTDGQTGRPAVNIRVGGAGLGLFKKETRDNVGKQMGVVYIETRTVETKQDGQVVKKTETEESVISVARINSALGSQFQITGLTLNEAKNLSLFLRAGALPASISIVEERTVGPSLGEENIRMGLLSIQVGFIAVLVAMILYYSLFGLIANIALFMNVILLVALLSLIGATLTLPGMAGIVLTIGMAVDANVLIFERIREELRNGMSPQGAIHSGFERAMATIIDSNLTTLIVGVILFGIGSGPIRGFAITLCIGIVTSMITAIMGTRAIVNIVYGGRQVKQLRVGI